MRPKYGDFEQVNGIICNKLTDELNELLVAVGFLLLVKEHKEKRGKDEWYKRNQPLAWERLRKIFKEQANDA